MPPGLSGVTITAAAIIPKSGRKTLGKKSAKQIGEEILEMQKSL